MTDLNQPSRRDQIRFAASRVLILLAVAAILVGLALSHWEVVLRYARLI
ncbi:MAG: hypothetical protein GX620_00865 [Chloroflexi bacterium]|nr:hypothetical protein [Chloroflexota bacterium]